jgi:ribose transport system substrate-binding protein
MYGDGVVERRRVGRGLVALAAAAGLAFAGAGCGSSDDDSGSTTAAAGATGTQAATTGGDQKPAKVAMIMYALTDYLQAEEAGVKAAVEPGGGSVKYFNMNYDPQKGLQQCNDAITSGRFNAIVLAAVDEKSGVPCVAAAKTANIPVITLDQVVGDIDAIDPTTDGVVGSISNVRKTNAAHYVEVIQDACKGIDPCKVVAEISTASDPYTNYAVDQVDALPNVEVVQRFASQYDPAAVIKSLPDILSAHPDTNVFMSIADTQALAGLGAIKSAGLTDKIKVVGNGGSRLGKKAVADGTMFGTLGTWPEQFGKAAGEMAVKAVNGQPIDPAGVDALNLDKPGVVIKSTVDEFQPEWGATTG